MRTTRTPDQLCPVCSIKLDRTTSFEGKTPRPRDVTICVQCLSVLMFDDGLQVRIPSPEEMGAIRQSAAWPDVQEIIRGLQRVKHGGNSSIS